MARSLRSKRKQANKRKLRADVFAPVEAARTARLAAAQKKIADTPKNTNASKNADASKNVDASKNANASKEAYEPNKVDESKSVEESMPASRGATPMEDDTPENGSQHTTNQETFERTSSQTLTMHRQFRHAAGHLCPAPATTRW
jgi:hypothetical protein